MYFCVCGGALALVDGKARLISEKYCDGLAACLGECPEGAISIVEREAEDFDEAAAKLNLAPVKKVRSPAPCACPGSAVACFDTDVPGEAAAGGRMPDHKSMLRNWPVQLTLVPPGAPFLAGADVSLVADCVPFAYADFHRDFAKNHSLLVACPKLDDYAAHLEKLTAVLRESDIKSLTVVAYGSAVLLRSRAPGERSHPGQRERPALHRGDRGNAGRNKEVKWKEDYL